MPALEPDLPRFPGCDSLAAPSDEAHVNRETCGDRSAPYGSATIRKRRCLTLVVCGLIALGSVASSGEEKPLGVGDAVPDVSTQDIDGAPLRTASYLDWVVVLSFADRESSEAMKAWMGDAQIRATKAHPELRVAYLSFADLSAVPGFLRGMVRPLLRRSFESSNDELAKSYREVGIEPDPSKVVFRFVPDWDGSHLETFGIENASAYRVWIAAGGRVVAALDGATPDVSERYVEAFDRIASPE
jgi:hypothetical protein